MCARRWWACHEGLIDRTRRGVRHSPAARHLSHGRHRRIARDARPFVRLALPPRHRVSHGLLRPSRDDAGQGGDRQTAWSAGAKRRRRSRLKSRARSSSRCSRRSRRRRCAGAGSGVEPACMRRCACAAIPAASCSMRSRASISRCGISAARRAGQPVFRLLGGPCHDTIPCYVSGLAGASIDARVSRGAASRRARRPRVQAVSAATRRPSVSRSSMRCATRSARRSGCTSMRSGGSTSAAR